VVLLTSRQGQFTATPSGFGGELLHPTWGTPSPEVTEPICRVPWRGFSRAPWDVHPAYQWRFAVRAPGVQRLEAFLGSVGSATYAITSRALEGDFPPSFIALLAWNRRYQSPAGLPSCVPPSLPPGGAGMLTGCASATPFGLALAPA